MMAGPDGPSTSGGPAGPAPQTTQLASSTANNAHPPISHPPHPQQHPPSDPGRPAYPSLAYPAAAGPSQPPQHFGQPGGAPGPAGHWGYNPYYFGGGGPHHAGGPPRPQANGGGAGGAYQPGFNPAYQGYPFPPHQQFYPPYGQMQVPGPGPGTMQNAYYVGGGYGGFPPNDAGANGAAGDDNGQAFHPNMPFQQNPYYPPNHPYAYGGGVGYQQHQHGMPYGGYRPDGFVHDHHPHPHHQNPHHMGHPHKGLNPAAQGFQYQGRTTPSSNGNVPNGTERQPPSAPPSSTPEIIAPVPEKAGPGSLGLSLGPAEPEAVAKRAETTPAAPAAQPAETTPAAQTAKPSEVTKPEVSKDVAPDAAPDAAPSEKADDESATDDGLTFTGSVLAGVDSPRSSVPSKPRSYAKDPILIRPSCPPPDAQGVYFATHLAHRIPDSVPREHVEGVRRRRSTTGYAQPKGKAVFTAGVKDGRVAAPATGLVFGEINSPPVTPVIASPPPPAAAAPKAKPSSWASLLRAPKKPGASTPDSLSVAPSSTLVSPSKSIVSLPPSDVGPETPRSSATASLPPSSGPAPSQPRPSINYAAAAAVGAPLSPAEDLARLLTDGVRARGPRPAQPITPRGLINTGNMCFANTILQVLVYCTPFTELFEELGKRLKADLARRTPLLEAMIYFLQEFVPGPSTNGPSSGTSTPKGKSRDVAFVPEHVYDAMKENKRFDSMRRGFQEDAEEYLGFFLNTLHEEMLNLYSRTKPPSAASKTTEANGHPERTIGRPVSPGANGDADGDDWLEVGKRQKTHVVRTAEAHESAVSRIFGGTLRSVLHAPGQKDSVTLEPYQPLQLDVQSADVVTLVDALKHLNEPETVPGVYVAARKANVDATKQVFLETFPQVLILHLKRFVYDPQEQNVVKRSKPVAYGTELVIPQDIISAPKRTGQPVKYRLFGVVYHHGYSATGGHYTVAVSRPDGTGWLHFDDESVMPVPTDDVVVSEDEARNGRAGNIGHRERCAYLLFYQRVR